MVLCLLNLRKHSNQLELDQFFKTINHKIEASQQITKSAFFQARKKLSYRAFIEINRQLIDGLYKNSNHYKTWKGFRLCAIDGTSIRLPNEPSITDHFGVQKGKASQIRRIVQQEWPLFFMPLLMIGKRHKTER